MKRLCLFYIRNLLCFLIFSFSAITANNSKKIIINEFLASNSNNLKDEDGNNSDWIELYNPGELAVDLLNWSLTDSDKKPQKWILPSVIIQPGEYMIVFASGKNRTDPNSELHTNFSLSADGEYLAIIEPDGTVSDEYAPEFPPQQPDISYGYYEGEPTYFEIPTPGTENISAKLAKAPAFSIQRGFFDEPFTVSLHVEEDDTKIYFTTDGTRPTAESTLYTGPVKITTTTPFSAVGINAHSSSPVVTHTYFFIKDISNQPEQPEGYPGQWGYLGSDIRYNNYSVGERAPAHYAMNPLITNDARYKPLLEEAFLSIPTVSMVTNPGYLFSDSQDTDEGGIYIYTGVKTGKDWERPVSLEYYEPSSGQQFQINCGLKLHGAASRQPEKNAKHSFRVSFRKMYGSGKLNFGLFEDSTAVTRFDHLVFRAGFNCTWMHHAQDQRLDAQYITDSYAKHLQRDMGHLSAHDRFVHLFINGLYWGIYELSERISNNSMEAYFGDKDTDYDIINHDGLSDGDITAFNKMVQLAQDGKYDELVSEKLLNMENFIDYMLLNFYLGNQDWGDNNWYAMRNRVNPGEGFTFFCWDSENCLRNVNHNVVRDNSTFSRFKGSLRQILFGNAAQYSSNGGLSRNEEFRLLFADRVHKHFFNGGTLTSEKASAIYEKLAGQIDYPVILESARWGSYRKDILTPRGSVAADYSRDDYWIPRKDELFSDYFPRRTEVVYSQMKTLNLTGAIEAPVFSDKGGCVDSPVELTMSAKTGVVYYTVNGVDPRVKGSGEINPSAVRYSSPLSVNGNCSIKARARNGSVWSALTEVSFIVENGTVITGGPLLYAKAYHRDNNLCIYLPEAGNITVEIYTASGNRMMRVDSHFENGESQLATSFLPQGVYVYKIVFNGRNISGKFIK